MWKSLLMLPIVLAFAACDSGGGSGDGSSSTTYSISGTLDTGATASSLSTSNNTLDLESLAFGLRARTACDDGQYYSVFCMTFTSPPVAAEGDVTCAGTSGAFTVDGLPKGEPIYCVVRRYPDATSTSGSNVGAIEIPTANLSGKSDTIVGNGNLQMAVTMNGNGQITAEVTGEQADSNNSNADSFFTAANANGTWTLACDNNNGGSEFSAGACKCFLGESFYGEGSYSNQDDCLNDPNGPGDGISSAVSLDIDMYIHPVTTTTDVPTDGGTIPSGTNMKAISIWAAGAKGSGGEGVTTLGGALNWANADATTAVDWSTGSVTIKDGSNADNTFTIPALPGDVNTMDHQDWVTWMQTVAAAAEGDTFDCTWGPASDAQTNNIDLDLNVECINQVMDALTADGVGATIPRVHLRPYCDQNGCDISSDASDNADPSIYNANAFDHVRVEFDDWHLDYPQAWADSDDYSKTGVDIGPSGDGIGVDPKSRFVFEPLQIHPNGAGFRQGHHGERHYQCISGAPGEGQVQNAACTGNYWELVCYYTEQLAIKFIGESSPMDVIFDQVQSPVAGRLIEHGGSGPQEQTPTGTNVIDMCETANGVSGFTFFASGTKN